MSISVPELPRRLSWLHFTTPGMFWLVVAVAGALIFFREGIDALFVAWQLPEYSHGPLIPVLSLLLFLRQLKEEPVNTGPVNRAPGLTLLVAALAFGLLGKLSGIEDVVAYALILWVGAILLMSFGWAQGKHFWPPVVHLVYMLPLPGVLYYKLSATLQIISSELGVAMLRLIDVPVFLEGNIIDLGVLKLHVAEACSGLRYLFPIMSFSYIFAVLYRGPVWHKAVLLLAAVPITVFMNSVRIAFAGWLANKFGVGWLEGFSHFFEGWVIFMISVLLLFGLAWLMLFLHPKKMGLVEALDLDTSGLGTQAARIRHIEASRGMILGAVIVVTAAVGWQLRPEPDIHVPSRDPFVLFPRSLGDWTSGEPIPLDQATEVALGADDYYSVAFSNPDAVAPVSLFAAYYEDQTKGGTHSPEICLPGGGWEIAMLERIDIAPEVGFDEPYHINRAIIQKGEDRMLVYYWFEQHGRHVAWDFAAKFYLLWDGIVSGRTDGAIVRLITPMTEGEDLASSEDRLKEMFLKTVDVIPTFVPGE